MNYGHFDEDCTNCKIEGIVRCEGPSFPLRDEQNRIRMKSRHYSVDATTFVRGRELAKTRRSVPLQRLSGYREKWLGKCNATNALPNVPRRAGGHGFRSREAMKPDSSAT